MQIENTKFQIIVKDEPKVFPKYVPTEPELRCCNCKKHFDKDEQGHEKYKICKKCAPLIGTMVYYDYSVF